MAGKPTELEAKHQIEALLFASGKGISIEQIQKLVNAKTDEIEKALEELTADYENRDTPLMFVREGDLCKLTTREKFLPVVRKIVSSMEMSKTLMETLAVIAYKAPVKQSNVISIRTNKAYDHIKELEKKGYITSEKSGRTRLLKLSQKFFDYFDITPDKVRERFGKYGIIESQIKEKEKEVAEKLQKMKISKKEDDEEDEIKEAIQNLDTHQVLKEKLEEQGIHPVFVEKKDAETKADEKNEVKNLFDSEKEETQENQIPETTETLENAIEKLEGKKKENNKN